MNRSSLLRFHVSGYQPAADRPLDGVNLLPVFKGERPTTRTWSYCWYAKEGQEDDVTVFARDTRYKLYRDGRFHDLRRDPLEEQPLATKLLDAQAAAVRANLRAVIDRYAKVEAAR